MSKVVNRAMREAQAETILKTFLEKIDPDIKGDAVIYTREEWDDFRGEKYGRNAYATMCLDGSHLYEVFNGYSETKTDTKIHNKLTTMLESAGFYFEMGYAWSLHVFEA